MDKKALQEKLNQVQKILKDIPGVYVHPLMNFAGGGNMTITRKGELKIPLALPANEVLGEGEDLRAVIEGRWKMVPILMLVEDVKE